MTIEELRKRYEGVDVEHELRLMKKWYEERGRRVTEEAIERWFLKAPKNVKELSIDSLFAQERKRKESEQFRKWDEQGK